LAATLQSLDQQAGLGEFLRVLVVDNASQDATPELLRSWQSARPWAHSIVEFELGVSPCRNAALQTCSEVDVLLYIDDDAQPTHPNWGRRLLEAYLDPAVVAAGGDAVPVWPASGPPDWLHRELHGPLGLVEFCSDRVEYLRYPRFPWGANLSFRRSALLRIGGFCTELGFRSGRSLVPGEETEACLRLQRQGGRIVSVPGAGVYHQVSSSKLDRDWIFHRGLAQGRSERWIELRHRSKLECGLLVVRRLLSLLFHLGKSAIHRNTSPALELYHAYLARVARGYLQECTGAGDFR
jgi:glycosyltransferase involved in cell wall biosynthesis